jgi:RNA polymerase sigma-70 factor (ECF subfamily)
MMRDVATGLDADDSDRCLIRAITERDEQALETLYARHWRTLLSYLIQQLGDHQLAEEVLQDVILAVWKGASGFRGECRVRTWLMAIARKRAITARQRQVSGTVPLDENMPAEGLHFLQNRTYPTGHDDVLAALDHLPKPERETIMLIFYHGLSGPDVATVMEVPEGTVRSRLRRAKSHLRKLLSKREPTNANA